MLICKLCNVHGLKVVEVSLESLTEHHVIDIAVSSITGGWPLCAKSTCIGVATSVCHSSAVWECWSSAIWIWFHCCRPAYPAADGTVQGQGTGIWQTVTVVCLCVGLVIVQWPDPGKFDGTPTGGIASWNRYHFDQSLANKRLIWHVVHKICNYNIIFRKLDILLVKNDTNFNL